VVFYIVPYILGGDYIDIYLVLLYYFVFRYLVLNKWYQRTFLGRKCGKIFLFFVDLFFRKKKEGRDILEGLYRFWCKIFKKWLYI
jgi:hypothetical protein